MIDGLKPYAAYRASPDRWLTQFPSTWDGVRIKYLLREIDRRTQTGEEPLLSMRRDHGLVPLSQFSDKVAEPKALLAYKLVRPGELVVNRMQAGNGLVFVARIPGLISPDYAIFRPIREVNLDYLELLFRSYSLRAKFRSESTGLGTGTAGFLRLYGDSLGAIAIALPSADEQSEIVRFLGYADRKIRNYIRAKKQLIALVAEKRETITHDALLLTNTRSMRLGVVADRVDRPISRRDDEVYTPVGLFNRGRGIFHKEPIKGADLGDSTFFWIEEGSLVLSGQFAWEGAIALAGREDTGCVASHRYPVLRGKPDLAESAYLLSFFKTGIGHLLLDQHSRGAAGRNRPLNAATLMKEKIPIPPLPAQQAIAAIVHLETRLSRSVAKAVELLREFRTRLIAEVVTGRLDVREAAACLPDDSNDSEAHSFDDVVSEGEASDDADLDLAAEDVEA